MKAFRIILITVQCLRTLQKKPCVLAKVMRPKPANKIQMSLITPVRRFAKVNDVEDYKRQLYFVCRLTKPIKRSTQIHNLRRQTLFTRKLDCPY